MAFRENARILFAYIIGSAIALVLLSLTVDAWGLAIAFLPVPNKWIVKYPKLINHLNQLVSFLPLCFIGAICAHFAFKSRAVLLTALCSITAYLIASVSMFTQSIEKTIIELEMMSDLIIVFLAGMPFMVWLLQKRRARKQVMNG